LDGPDLRNCLKVRLQITTGTDHWVDFCWSVVDILTNEKRKLKGQTTKGLKFHQDLIYLNKTACMEWVLVSKSKKKKKSWETSLWYFVFHPNNIHVDCFSTESGCSICLITKQISS
jgi:hypothetical protein